VSAEIRSPSRITGVGAELPPHVITSAEVEARAGVKSRLTIEAGWLERATGVRERRWAGPEVDASELAVSAGRKALADAGLDPLAIDTLLFAGVSRDRLSTAGVVAEAIGTRQARVFDLLNGANSLLDAIDVADALIRSGKAQRVLITASEQTLPALDGRGRTAEEMLEWARALVLGDGGGAIVVEPSDDPRRGFRAREFRSEPTPGPGARRDQRDLMEAAFALLHTTMEVVMDQSGWRYEDLDVVFCHQPTGRLVDQALADGASEAARKLWRTAERFGNTGTVSLPLAMAEAQTAGTLVPGARVLLLVPSPGVSAAAVTMVW
jgi:3-oxoacyl-[acyl-carrier-protein] synthase-3